MPKDEKDDIKEITSEPEVLNEKVVHEDIKHGKRTSRRRDLLFLIVATLASTTLAVLICFAFMTAFMPRSSNVTYTQDGGFYSHSYRVMPRMNRVFIQTSSSSNTSNTTMVSGVVKSVGTNTFVIAGNGNQTTVNTTGGTTYNTTDKKVSVNDTVMVIGTVSNSVITATGVQIINF